MHESRVGFAFPRAPRGRCRWLLLALAPFLFFSLIARSALAVTYRLETSVRPYGRTIPVLVTLADLPEGDGVEITLSVERGRGDLIGFFANLDDESLLASLSVESPSNLVSAHRFVPNRVWRVGFGNAIWPAHGFDIGLRFGHGDWFS